MKREKSVCVCVWGGGGGGMEGAGEKQYYILGVIMSENGKMGVNRKNGKNVREKFCSLKEKVYNKPVNELPPLNIKHLLDVEY